MGAEEVLMHKGLGESHVALAVCVTLAEPTSLPQVRLFMKTAPSSVLGLC